MKCIVMDETDRPYEEGENPRPRTLEDDLYLLKMVEENGWELKEDSYLKRFQDYRAEALQNPEVKEQYDALQPEFESIKNSMRYWHDKEGRPYEHIEDPELAALVEEISTKIAIKILQEEMERIKMESGNTEELESRIQEIESGKAKLEERILEVKNKNTVRAEVLDGIDDLIEANRPALEELAR